MIDQDEIDRCWALAIDRWRRRRPELVMAEIKRLTVPGFAKEFLIDLAMEKVAPLTNGRPPNRTPAQERALVCEVFSERDLLKVARTPDPRAKAISIICERRRMSESAA